MAKLIKITQEAFDKEIEKFKLALSNATSDITYKVNYGTVSRKATVLFTPEAYCKMQELIAKCDKEIAWNGLAKRASDDLEDDRYIIYDILCHPQEVTGATVTTDQSEHEKWLMELDDDTFNNLRFQGHSHVNMGVTPSSTDERLYEEYLARLDSDMFYIFQIWNKKGDKTIKIYDFAKNIFFDTADCEVKFLGIEDFADESLKMVKNKTYTAPAITKQTTTSYTNTTNNKNSNKKKGKRVENKNYSYSSWWDCLRNGNYYD